MDSWIQRISALAPVVLPIAGAIIAMMVFVVRLDNDTRHLQEDVYSLRISVVELQEDVSELQGDMAKLQRDVVKLQGDVSELQEDVAKLQEDMAEVKANQQRILDALENIEVALGNHVHEPDGTVRVTLTSR